MSEHLEKQGFWSRITRPSDAVPKLERRTARLLAALLIARMGVHSMLLLMSVSYVLSGRQSSWVGIRINLVGIGISVIIYMVSRSRRYKIAATVLVIETIILIFSAVISGVPGYDFSLTLIY